MSMIYSYLSIFRPYKFTLIDRLLIKEFIKTLIGSHALFLGLFLFMQLINDIPYFIERMNAGDSFVTVDKIISMYLNGIPYKILWVSPIAFTFSNMFTLGNLYKHNEAVAYVAAGIHIIRFGSPLIIISLVYSMALIPIMDILISPTFDKAEGLNEKMRHDWKADNYRNLEVFGKNDIYYLIGYFEKKDNKMLRPIIGKENKAYGKSEFKIIQRVEDKGRGERRLKLEPNERVEEKEKNWERGKEDGKTKGSAREPKSSIITDSLSYLKAMFIGLIANARKDIVSNGEDMRTKIKDKAGLSATAPSSASGNIIKPKEDILNEAEGLKRSKIEDKKAILLGEEGFPEKETRRRRAERIVNPKVIERNNLTKSKNFFERIKEPKVSLSLSSYEKEYYDKKLDFQKDKYLSKNGNKKQVEKAEKPLRRVLKKAIEITESENKEENKEENKKKEESEKGQEKDIEGGKTKIKDEKVKKSRPLARLNEGGGGLRGGVVRQGSVSAEQPGVINKKKTLPKREVVKNGIKRGAKDIEIDYDDIYKLSLLPSISEGPIKIFEVKDKRLVKRITNLSPNKAEDTEENAGVEDEAKELNKEKLTNNTPLISGSEIDLFEDEEYIESLNLKSLIKAQKLKKLNIKDSDFAIDKKEYLRLPTRSFFHYRIDAKQALWDEKLKRWVAYDGELRVWIDNKLTLKKFKKHVIEDAVDEPSHFTVKRQEIDRLTTKEVMRLIDSLKKARKDVKGLEIDLYAKKFAFPLATFLLVFMTSTIGRFHSRKLVFVNSLFKGITIFLIYFTIFQLSVSLSKVTNILPPTIGAWSGNIIFFLAGLYWLKKAHT